MQKLMHTNELYNRIYSRVEYMADSYNNLIALHNNNVKKKIFLICLLTYAQHQVLNLLFTSVWLHFATNTFFLSVHKTIHQSIREPVRTQTQSQKISIYRKPVSVVKININYHQLNAVVWPHSAKILLDSRLAMKASIDII